MNPARIATIIIISLSLCAGLFSCHRASDKNAQTNSAWPLSVRDSIFSEMLSSGRTKELAELVSSVYENAKGKDGNLEGLCASHLIAVYTSLGMQDSAMKYISIDENEIPITDRAIIGKIHNARAKYFIKYELDYVRAMEYLQKALKEYRAAKDTSEEIIVLNNISSIYYLRNDTTSCLDYIRQARSLADKISDPYSKCVSLIFAAQMYYSFGMYEESLEFAAMARSIISSDPALDMFTSTVAINEGYVHIYNKEYGKALACYNEALEHIEPAAKLDRSVYTNLDVYYADYLYGIGETGLSKKYYLKSLESHGGGRHNRQRILKRLANLYSLSSDKDSALIYYKQYHEISDSIFNFFNEREFSKLILDNEKEKYRQDMSDKDQSLSRTRKVAIIVSAAALLIVVILMSVLAIYRKKDRMYTELVKKHQELLKKQKEDKNYSNSTMKADSKEKMETDLFRKIEALMENDRIYRNQEISLDSLSEMLGTNRTYISNVINKYSGMSFSSYINSFRIKEATEIISDTSREVILKVLYSKIGYNSISSFYRAFQKETGCTPMVYREKILKLKGTSVKD